jgi:hypothetical protein
MGDRAKLLHRAGWAVSLLIIAFMLMDASVDLMQAPFAVKANAGLGIPATLVLPIGIVALVCTLLYAAPPTAVLGAILLSGFLGGAAFTHLRIGGDIAWDVAENILIGVLAWGGLWLRDPKVRSLIPIRRT